MSLQLSEVQSETEFTPIGALMQTAWTQPFNSLWEILKGESEAECTSRYWAWHAQPGSRWLQVKDIKTDEVVGAAEWIVHEKNPFENGNPIPQGSWWADENMKNITDQALLAFLSRRPRTMSRSHILLNICFVSPEHRRQGVGRKLMEWGCRTADEKGLEGFVEATEDGVKLYESAGFVRIERFTLEPILPDGKTGEEAAHWTRLKRKAFPAPYPVWLMWRPEGGNGVEGVSKYSWGE